MVEKAVGISKSIRKKAREDRRDYLVGLMEYRSTPISGLDLSPAQMMFNRRLKTKLPISNKLLNAELCNNIREKLIKRQNVQKIHYDKTAHPLPELEPEEELNLTVPEGAKIAKLKSLIVNSDVYKKDKELVRSAIDYALEKDKNKRLDSETKLEFERIKLAQLQKQLEFGNIQKNLPQNSDIQNQSVLEVAANINIEILLKSMKTFTIPVPSRVESYNLFFQSLEKAFKIRGSRTI
ncbi:transposon Tf2-6 polyprotein [Trichonephila clavipes]|nr:transposon Tf2-6 polyprotein [Trichonephila clavipes]